MLSAEATSHHENLRQQQAYQARIRNSLVAASSLPWDPTEVVAGERRKGSSAVTSRRQSQSVHFHEQSAKSLEAKKRRATILSKMRNIFKFEILLDKRAEASINFNYY